MKKVRKIVLFFFQPLTLLGALVAVLVLLDISLQATMKAEYGNIPTAEAPATQPAK